MAELGMVRMAVTYNSDHPVCMCERTAGHREEDGERGNGMDTIMNHDQYM